MKHRWFLFCLLLLLLAGCSAQSYRENADKEVYQILGAKEKLVTGKQTAFTIEPKPAEPLPEPLVLGLSEALNLAAERSRDYQSRKEDLYIKALNLTYQRYLYRPRFQVGGSADWQKANEEETFTASGNISLLQWLADGAEVSANFVTDFLRHLTGSPQEAVGSIFSLNLLQPLLSGAGRRVAQENLTQAERDVIYQIRSFLRYQRSFSVEIATNYYRLLEQKMVLTNEESNAQRLRQNRERAEALGEAGRIPFFQVDQARQNELQAMDRVVLAQKTFQEALDQFKIKLGLPLTVTIQLPESEEKAQIDENLPEVTLKIEEALTTAAEKRLDLLNAKDEVADRERKVMIAKDNLRGILNLTTSMNATTPDDQRTGTDIQFDEGTYHIGFNLKLPTDRLKERNAYRLSLIDLERVQRSFTLLQDNINLQVRSAWRTLEQARSSYQNQRRSLQLAWQRVDNTNLLLEAGRASQRDLLDAQADYLSAQNGVVAAATDYISAHLSLLRDTETLSIGPNGVWDGHL